MAVYKVPQDVEAEDKLIGPFGFRQFIYLAIAAGAGFMCYVFYNILPPLIIIPLPIMAGFLILALPLRKEQPMETYVLALIRFYLKPKQRKWNPDGTITYVEIVAPKVTEQHLAKDYGADTASERIDYLARVMDSRGWALKGTTNPGSTLTTDAVAAAEHAEDVFDDNASVAQSFTAMIAQQDEKRRQAAIAQMQRAAAAPTTPAPVAQVQPEAPMVTPHYDPYPASMHQRVIQPYNPAAPASPPPAPTPVAQPQPVAAAPAQTAPAAPVPAPISPDIIRLSRNDDLSISAIAHEAHRLRGEDEEVVIKLH